MGRAFRKAQRFLKISANQLNAGETGIARANQQKLDCKTFYMLTYKTLNILFFLKNDSCFFHAEDYEYGKTLFEVTQC